MTSDEEAIDEYRKVCESIGVDCCVMYLPFENGDNVRVTITVDYPITMACIEALYDATKKMRAVCGLRDLSAEMNSGKKTVQ